MSTMFREFSAGLSAFEAPLDARLAFIRRTYVHVTGAALAFVAASWALHVSGLGESMLRWVAGGRWGWFLLLGAFALVGWMAQSFARKRGSPALQYAGLSAYVGMEAVIFAPILAIATRPEFGNTLSIAAGLTVLAFGALSAFVLVTKKDFSFLGPALFIGSLVALGVIVCGMIFGFNLGLWFSGAMILFAIGAVLYSTSNALHNYRTDEHVAAAVELFAAVALLFYYVLMFLLQSQRRN
jgi:hypothetical protein